MKSFKLQAKFPKKNNIRKSCKKKKKMQMKYSDMSFNLKGKKLKKKRKFNNNFLSNKSNRNLNQKIITGNSTS